MSDEYKPNSHRSREEEKKKVGKVIKGEARTKKKSSMEKFTENFVSEDLNTVFSNVIFDVFIPAFKDTIYDMITTGFGMLLNGGEPQNRYHSSRDSYSRGRSQRTNYNNPNSNRPKVRDRRNIDNIFLDSRAEAEEVLDALYGIIDEYGMASISDLNELLGKPSNYTDQKYGWFDVGTASISRTHDGYMLKLPKITQID